MFIDIVDIEIKAGNGGNGVVSFHRDKFNYRGGPDGGNGGRGGNIIFVVDENLSNLSDFRNKKNFFAKNGKDGSSNKCSGKNGEDLVIRVPCGTLIKDRLSGSILFDMCKKGLNVVVAKGGLGGAGNINFKTSVNRTPMYAKDGKPGESFSLCLELKLLADVGLVGMPNCGKSTLISRISNAKSKIGNYPFTTISPVLGVVNYKDISFTVADIPGLICGASAGCGLGHKFLRHIQRCKLLIHIVDISEKDSIKNFELINEELNKFDKRLSSYPMFVVANKCNIVEKDVIVEFKNYLFLKGYELFEISAVTGFGVESLLDNIIFSIA
ncbi:MAG: GTPase ObgE [Firmicutes bacterium]|nr:GTPase ObgE [Bacillota bacterium]